MTEVLVPPLGQTVDTLTLVSWYKREGDTVQHGEPLYSVETDKATLDVEAPATGVLRRVTANPGDVVKVLSAIAVIEAEDEVKAEVKIEPVSTLALTSTSRLFVSPRARRLAEAEGVPLAEVRATGPQGAIIERDVLAHMTETRVKAQAGAGPRLNLSLSLGLNHARGAADRGGGWPGLGSDSWHRPVWTNYAGGCRAGNSAKERTTRSTHSICQLLASSFQLPPSHSLASAPSSLSGWSRATAALRR